MTPDSDADPDRPESAPVSPSLSPNDHLAIDAAVAGVAGLLLGRALFGRAGGLVAGIAAMGAGLLAKRVPPAKKTDAAEAPASPAVAEEAVPDVLPVTHMRLETGGVPAANDWPALEVAEPPLVTLAGVEEELEETDLPESPPPTAASPALDDPAGVLAEDAGAFAEMPALFTAPDIAERAVALPIEPDIFFGMPEVETAAVPPTDAADDNGKFAFDGHPLRPDVEILPVAELVERADKDLASEALPPEKAAPPPLQTARVPATEPSLLGLLEAFPSEYAPLLEEPEAGPREEFLMIPDLAPDFPPPIQPVVVALSASLEPAAATPTVAARAPKTVMDEPRAAPPEVPDDKPVDPPLESGVPVPDPEEIWRQAAVELAALRSAPVPVLPPPAAPAAALPPLPIPLPAIPIVSAPAPPPFPSLAATTGTAPVPAAEAITSVVDKPEKPAEPPPWLKEVLKEPPLPEVSPETAPGADKAFLPTIRLAVPQSPPALSARRPVPLSPGREATAPSPALPPPVAPVALPVFRAEPLLPPLHTPPVAHSQDSTVPVLPPVPVAPATAPVPVVAQGPLIAPPAFAAASQPVAAAGDAKIFVSRRISSRRPDPRQNKKRLITPFRVVLLAIFAAGALGMAFKPQLIEFWEHRILGMPAHRPKQSPSPAPGASKSSPVQGDAPDVKIAREPAPVPAPAPAPKVPVADPAKEGTPPLSPPPAGESSPPVIPLPPDIQAIPESPPPAAEPETSGPLPTNETGARELVSRLLRATSPEGVKPYILEPARLAPGLEEYFTSGRAVPVASWEINLERADKVAGKRTLWQFRVVTDNVPRGFPVGVEETPDGLRADWELFAQCRDGALRTFLDDPAADPGRFYAALKRAHTFPDMLPGQDHTAFFAFEIASPAVGASPTTVFIRKGTPLATRADGLFKWETAYAPVLEIAHKNGSVEITAIVRENWRATARQSSR